MFLGFSAILTPFHLQIINECSKAELWLRDRTQQQDSLPKNVDPVLWSSEIKKRTEALNA